ncbi:YcnI family protein [Cohnella faecalis]|uniref:DUF1775 domain-containing protein n=1 Tax=Cohnella faecalis TaxID=2315694 RepID=A0A398CXB0_9BACL|nr:YcnI family protein [Cohnella faecalis]RIE03634.1 DUF1775 domain-containing protein [Cohnella faecalis]
MKKSLVVLLVLLFTIAGAGLASAHVTVQPQEVAAGSYQVFTLRVPTEKDVATTQVKIEVPAEVTVSRFEPKSDWTYDLEKDADGKIVSVTWKSTGKGLSATEFGQFLFQGKVADEAKELVWKSYQTYADNSVVEWTGAADAEKPASVTTVTAKVEGSDGHGAAGSASGAAHDDGDNGSDRDTLTLSLAIAGLAAGVLALLVALFRRGGKRA